MLQYASEQPLVDSEWIEYGLFHICEHSDQFLPYSVLTNLLQTA